MRNQTLTMSPLLPVILLSYFLLQGCSSDTAESSIDDDTSGDDDTTSLPAALTTTVKDGTVVETTALVALGEQLYRDTNLSVPAGQACASCHEPTVGFDDPAGSASSIGADGTSIGNRNSPTASYAAHIPDTQIVLRNTPGGGPAAPTLIGGQFLDGRAESLEEQAKGPFLNASEMNNASKSDVIDKVKSASYASNFQSLFGEDSFDDVDSSYDYIADAIAAFERSALFSPFTSKFDQVQQGTATFTAAEQRGENLFNGKAQCDRCHSTPNGSEQVFSNFEYKNIGVPANQALIDSLGAFVDSGLGDVTNDSQDNGKFRTPNLRNIAITAPYMHNGVFTSLEEVIDFYNTRDTTFPDVAEVNQNIDQGANIGELGLNSTEVADLVTFLETLTDE